MQAQYCVQLTVTNDLAGFMHTKRIMFLGVYLTSFSAKFYFSCSYAGLTFLVIICRGSHPFPSRTRPLSPEQPMVVGR